MSYLWVIKVKVLQNYFLAILQNSLTKMGKENHQNNVILCNIYMNTVFQYLVNVNTYINLYCIKL